MEQRKFTLNDFVGQSTSPGIQDAVLDPNDPIFQMSGQVKVKRDFTQMPQWQQHNPANEKARMMREQGIKPGTPAWFQLWYGK